MRFRFCDALLRQSFNRYMVECELDNAFTYRRDTLVLIDTWWNVNVFNTVEDAGLYVSFNRYMVECEYVQRLDFHPAERRFNRYMVECELFSSHTQD